MRRAARTDANHRQIVDALRAVGCKVRSLAALGGGIPDLLVLGRMALQIKGGEPAIGKWVRPVFLLEVKDGSKSRSRRRLTPAEQQFHDEWGAAVQVVSSVNEALAAVGADAMVPVRLVTRERRE